MWEFNKKREYQQKLYCSSGNKKPNIYEYKMCNVKLGSLQGVKDVYDFSISKILIEKPEVNVMESWGLCTYISYSNKDTILPAYISLIRPHLKFSVQFWKCYHAKDIAKLEAIKNKPYVAGTTKHVSREAISMMKTFECFKIQISSFYCRLIINE